MKVLGIVVTNPAEHLLVVPGSSNLIPVKPTHVAWTGNVSGQEGLVSQRYESNVQDLEPSNIKVIRKNLSYWIKTGNRNMILSDIMLC